MNPKLFEQAAIADSLGLSLDELMGINGSAEKNELLERVHALEIESFCRNESLSNYRTIMYALIGICVLLILVVIGYMIFDAHIIDAGLFQSAGMSAFAVLLAMVLLAAVAAVLYAMHTIRKK